MITTALSTLDARIGDGIERLVREKHHRRLSRLGSGDALDPPAGGWANGEPPPRSGCLLRPLVDGHQAFSSIADGISRARETVHVAGWHVAPSFELIRGDDATILGELLAEAAERIDVRVLLWAGSPVPLFHPTRGEVAESIRSLTRRSRIRCESDPREHPFHCHHEKVVVIDDQVAFVGGIDITDFGGDRFDTPAHPARRRLGWHDVAAELRGPAVADVADHFAMRWSELTGERLERSVNPVQAGRHTVQVVRTVSNGMYRALTLGEFRILESYLRAIRAASSFIYLENQFLWAPEIVDALARKLRDPPSPDFRLVVVLPSKANNGHDDTLGQLGVLEAADDGAGRLLAATLRARSGNRDDRLYVHAKVGIVDDRWLTIGSANLNAHSLFNDTEMNLVSDDADLARDTRIRLWSEHLEVAPDSLEGLDVAAVVDELWNPIAREQLERDRAGAVLTRKLLALPGVSRRSMRLLGPLVGLVDDG